jgi:hypothetical protein
MDEIMTKCWDETATTLPNCGGTVSYSDLQSDGEDRTACTGAYVTAPYDDIDDYNNYTETCTVGGVSYSKSVAVCYVPYNNLTTSTCNTTAATGTDYKRIAVTVSGGSTSVTLTTVMTNY